MKIVIIGAGNVATHFGTALQKAGHEIMQVFSRSETSAKELSRKLHCSSATDIFGIVSDADLYIVALSDDAVSGFLSDFPYKNKPIAHTSGSLPLKIFGRKYPNCGVLYPVQTFSKSREIDMSETPLLVEAKNARTLAAISSAAQSLSRFVFRMNSDERKTVHLAAVIVNNFVNHLYIQAEKVLEEKKIPFLLLAPLMNETASKALHLSPEAAQTGPAKRGDTQIIKEQLKAIKGNPDLKRIYKLLTDTIRKTSGAML